MRSISGKRVSEIYNEFNKSLSLLDESDHPLFQERGLSLGCPIIDDIIGGIKTQGITEIAGEAGCGKTQCCLVLSLHNHLSVNLGGLKGSCAYLCCGEGEFPIRRLSQLALTYEKKYNIAASEFLSNIHIEQCANTENVLDTIASKLPEMCQRIGVTLIIIDSLAGAIRNEYDTNSSKAMAERTNKLFSFSSQLKRLADSYRVAIVVVNQVTSGNFDDKQKSLNFLRNTSNFFNNNSTIPALGLAWSFCINTRIMLRKDDNAVRAILTMSDSAKENLRQQIAICDDNDDEEKDNNNLNTLNYMNTKQYKENDDNNNNNNNDNNMISSDLHDSTTHTSSTNNTSKSIRYLTLEFSPTNPSRTIQYEITQEGVRGLHTLQDFGAKFD